MGPEERESIDEPIRRLLGEHREAIATAGAHAEHVDDETLARHASGDLPSAAALEVAKHLATCDADCADRLREHAASVNAAREGLYPEVAPQSAVARRAETGRDAHAAADLSGRDARSAEVRAAEARPTSEPLEPGSAGAPHTPGQSESAMPPRVSERTHPGKSVRSFVARDVLWEMFEGMARELECSVDYLMNESMKLYVRHRSQSARTPAPGRASIPPGASPRPDPTAPSMPPMPMIATPMPVVPVGTPHPPAAASLATPPSMRTPLPSAPTSRPSGPPPLPPVSRPSGPPPMPPLSVRPTVPAPPPSYGGAPPAFGTPPPLGVVHVPPPPPAGYASYPMGRPTPAPFPAAMQQPPPPPPPMQMPMNQPPPMPGYGQQLPQYGMGPAQPPASLSAYYAGQRHVVSKDRFIIGRGKNTTDLTVRDPNISRQHAMVEYSDGTYYMVDLGSTNGVEYTGQRISRKAIGEGDLFVICGHEIRFSFR